MQVISHGIDMVRLEDIRRPLSRSGKGYLLQILSEAELALARNLADPVPFYAGRFAAKEAVLKSLGTGWRDGIAWHEVQVLRRDSAEPFVELMGNCLQAAKARGIARILVSITHTDEHAMASALGLGVGL